jgi:NhaA family Na+:H+ antiporter
LLFSWIIIQLGYAQLPEGANWQKMAGIALLCGIGFTMSLFIGSLAFTTEYYMNQVRLGVILGSLLSAVVGYLILYQTTVKR